MEELKKGPLRSRISNIPAEEKSSQSDIDQHQQDIGTRARTSTAIDTKSILHAMYQPRDPASLGVFRFVFGLLMAVDIPQERGLSDLAGRWGDPEQCYFPLFDWLTPLSLEWMYMIYVFMFVCAIGIMLGFMYRLSCIGFVLTYWYIFFLEKSYWNNHSYLYGLTGVMLLITDAHHYWSIDSLIWPSIKNTEIPRWHYGIFKFQIFIVYFYAGIKKCDLDWITGFSMTGLGKEWVFDPLRLIFSDNTIDHVVVHIFGWIFDLLEGFLLFFDQTRLLGFILGGSFHLMNSQMFSIGMFPWTMLATMPIFCYADWPKKLVSRLPDKLQWFWPSSKMATSNVICSQASKGKFSIRQKLASCMFLGYVMIQLLLPFSHSITQGYNSWTNGLYGYSWDMMVHSWSTQHVVVKVVDKTTGVATYFKPDAWLNRDRRRWHSHPDMMKQYALCLKQRIRETKELNIKEPEIYFDLWRSLNKRFQQRSVDPRVDIVTAEWSPFILTKWIRPLLTDLTPWRNTLQGIKATTWEKDNITDMTFVADFPGLSLENHIDASVSANLTVLHGQVVVESIGGNTTLNVNDTMNVPKNETHIVHVVSTTPACYMYKFYNTSWLVMNETEGEKSTENDADISWRMKERMNWKNKTITEKAQSFFWKKYRLFNYSFRQSYFAFQLIWYGPEVMYPVPNREDNSSFEFK